MFQTDAKFDGFINEAKAVNKIEKGKRRSEHEPNIKSEQHREVQTEGAGSG
jgi:hypothetical protein